jgi:divalent metal cation (Fe/Co/Zn/Cd) transporter
MDLKGSGYVRQTGICSIYELFEERANKMNEQVIIAITLIREVHRVLKYKVRYMGSEYTATVVTSESGYTFNYDGEEIERIPEQVLDFVEGWIQEQY